MNLKEDLKEDKILVLTGCTSSGKTALIKKLVDFFPIEVISCDSRQIYKYMDIGTAKPDKETLSKVPHHLIDIKYPNEYFSAFDFYENVIRLKNEIEERNKIPIIVGGTILYILSLQNGLFKMPKIPKEVKDLIKMELQKFGIEKLYNELLKVDYERAKKIHPNDKQRIFRSIEIYRSTGIKHSEWLKKEHYKGLNLIIFNLSIKKEELNKNIEKRTLEMIEKGFKEEVIRLLDMGYNKDDYGLTSVGYREMIEHINGDLEIDDAIKLIIKRTKEYAKRQRTFIKKLKIYSEITFDNFEILSRFLGDETKNKNR